MTSKIRVLLLRLQRHQIQVLTQVQMQDLMQEQIPVPIKEWSRASVKAQIQINTTKRMCGCTFFFVAQTRQEYQEIKYIRVSQNNASEYRHNFQLQVQKCQGSYDSH